MKKFLSVTLSLVMLFTATTFNGSCAFGEAPNGVPQSNVETVEKKQRPRKRQVNAKRNNKEESIGTKVSNAISSGAKWVSENKGKVVIAGGILFGLGLGCDVYSNVNVGKDLMIKVWNNSELSIFKRILSVLKLSIIGDKDRKEINKLNKKAAGEKKQEETAKDKYNRIKKEKDEAEKIQSNLGKNLSEKQEIVVNIKNGQDKGNNVAGKSIGQLKEEAYEASRLLKGVEANISVAQQNVNAANQSFIIANNNCTDYKAKFDRINATYNTVKNNYDNTLNQLKEKCKGPGYKFNANNGICEIVKD